MRPRYNPWFGPRRGGTYTETKVAGHGDCSTCHPITKSGRPKEKHASALDVWREWFRENASDWDKVDDVEGELRKMGGR